MSWINDPLTLPLWEWVAMFWISQALVWAIRRIVKPRREVLDLDLRFEISSTGSWVKYGTDAPTQIERTLLDALNTPPPDELSDVSRAED